MKIDNYDGDMKTISFHVYNSKQGNYVLDFNESNFNRNTFLTYIQRPFKFHSFIINRIYVNGEEMPTNWTPYTDLPLDMKRIEAIDKMLGIQ